MATTPSDPDGAPPPVPAPAPHDATDLRLHPFSWLFVLLTQMRPLVLPLIVLIVLGRGMGWELWGLVGAMFVALYSLIYSFGFRYRLDHDELVVREGIFFRTERHVPYARIQNVVQQRNVLHRAFGVTELHLESAGGAKPEAVMNVITLAAAARIEALLARGGASAAPGEAETPPLLALDTRELLRLGLMSNRGAVIVGALFALFYQFEPWQWRGIRSVISDAEDVFERFHEIFIGPLAFLAAATLALAIFLVVLKLLSIAMAFVAFHGFRLRADAVRVSTVSGLFTQRSASARLDKIQRYTVSESWLAHRLGRRALECDVATGGGTGDGSERKRERLRWLAPIATPAQIDALLHRIDPQFAPAQLRWRPLHPKAWRRMFKQSLIVWSLASLPVTGWFGAYAAIFWSVMVTYSWFAARGSARFAAYCHDGRTFAFRSGWLQRRWTFARVEKGQNVALTHSPFDRRAGMANVRLDTAGAGATSFALAVPYLPDDEAHALFAALSRAISTAPGEEPAHAGAAIAAAPVANPG